MNNNERRGRDNVIIQSYKIGNTLINIADDCIIQDENQRRLQIDSFNRAGYRIMQNLILKEKRDKNK